MNDDTSDDNTIWINSATTTTGNVNFTFTAGTAYLHTFTRYPIIPDKDWMPYRHFEYDPLWHKKFAGYKLQMQSMWD